MSAPGYYWSFRKWTANKNKTVHSNCVEISCSDTGEGWVALDWDFFFRGLRLIGRVIICECAFFGGGGGVGEEGLTSWFVVVCGNG